MAVTESDVFWAYRTFLDRAPENDSVVRDHCQAPDLRSLCDSFMGSAEYRHRSAIDVDRSGQGPLPIFVPRLHIDTTASEDELRQLWGRVRQAWEGLGVERPFHSVLTEQRYAPDHIKDSAAEFWQSGVSEARSLAEYLAGLGLVGLADAMLVEYGCGIGRVAIPLAALVQHVVTYDISEPHLEIARERAKEVGQANIRMMAIGSAPPEQFEPCDVFYSRIVLQHNPPPIIGYVVRKLIRALKKGGVGVFQVPTYHIGYSFNLRDALGAAQNLDMEMHCYPQADLFSLIAQEGARLIQMREDDAPGRRDLIVSNTFVLTKTS